MATSKQYRVVKSGRGGQGEWFDFSRGTPFALESEAREHAASFAAEQRAAGVTCVRITVRLGDRTLCAHNVNRGDVLAARANADVEYAAEVA